MKTELAAAAGCASVALVLAILPHLTMLARYGSPAYLSDGDEAYYLAIARPPYHGEIHPRDALVAPWEPAPAIYAWLQFVPLARVTRALGLPLVLMSVVWRVVGGILFGATLYLLYRRVLGGGAVRHPVAWAVGCTLVSLADVGFVEGRTVVGTLRLLGDLAAGATTRTSGNAMPGYRVVTPLLNLQALLLLIAVLAQPWRRRWLGAAAGALALGLCVLLYFYLWTAAVVTLGLILAGWVAGWAVGRVPAARLRTELAFGTAVLAGGLLIGSPQVVSNVRTASDPAVKPVLQRLVRGQVLPPGHPSRSHYLVNAWVFAKLALGAAVVLALGAWRLAPVWAGTLAGFLMLNSAIVTGREYENFHWIYVYGPLGEVLLLAALAVAWDRLSRGSPGWRRSTPALWALPVVLVAIAAAWRPFEALRSPEAVDLTGKLHALEPVGPALGRLGRDDVLAGPAAVNVALLYTEASPLSHVPGHPHGSVIPDRQLHERDALNAWLMGLDLSDYAAVAGRERVTGGELVDPSWRPEAVRAARVAIFRSLLEGGAGPLLARYRPSALLRPAAAGPPTRGGHWTAAASAGAWALWTRDADRPPG